MRALPTILLAVLSCFFAAAQTPVNDDCSGIIDLGEVPYCSQAAQYTNINATTSNIDAFANVPVCWNNPADRDVWFEFSLPADGSLVDVTVSVWGNVAGNGTLEMPQLAVYRGDCVFNGLAELACVAAPLNVNETSIDLFGLTPGVPYFIRINDYSASAMPNAGTFKLCVEKYEADLNMGDAPGTSACSGTLWDSGGPDGDYISNENETFVICPTEFHQCIKLHFPTYATEFDFDYIRIYEGDDTGGALLATLDGVGNDFELQVSAQCVTIEFNSDNSIEEAGFQMTWQCSAEVCDAPPPVLPSNALCDHALSINGCDNSLQTIPLSPGEGDPNFIQDGVNAGCIQAPSADLNFSFFYFQAGADGDFGFLVKNADPTLPADIDFSVWGPIDSYDDICDFATTNQPVRSSWTFAPDPLLNPEALTGLTNFHPVTGFPVVDSLDCGSLETPGQGILTTDNSFVRTLPVQEGKFYLILLDNFDGFIEQNGISIDLSGTSEGVLGPVAPPITVSNDTFSCNGTPVQLQVTGGTAFAWTPSTGLSCNTCPNPFASPTETTTYEVKVVDVCQSLTQSVTVSVGPNVTVQGDTAICNGESVTLGTSVPQAGTTYVWTPNDGSLSDASIANPVATPNQTTVYTLTASSGPCVLTRVVTVAVVTLDLQVSVQDTSICRGESVAVTAAVSPALAINWSPLTQIQVQPDGMSALATPQSSIVYNISASLPGCTRTETLSIHVDSLPQKLAISPADTLVCGGSQVLLVSPTYSGVNFPNIAFLWQTSTGQTLQNDDYFLLANPSETTTYQRITTNGICVDTASATIQVIAVPTLSILPASPQLCVGESTVLSVQNAAGLSNPQWSPPIGLSCILCTDPTAAPSSTTTYQFTASVGNGCSASASVVVEVNQLPVFQLNPDTICAGESLLLNLVADTTVTYTWTSSPPGFASSEAQPQVTPAQTTTYAVTLENGCTVQQQMTVQVVPSGNLTVSDSAMICPGVSTQLTASGNFPGTYVWSTGETGQVVSVAPTQTTTYTITYHYPLQNPQCQAIDSVVVAVQGAVAQVLFPADTLLCPGEGLMLNTVSTPGATYSWTSNPTGFSSQEAIPPVFFPEESAVYTVTTQLDNCTVVYEIDVTVFNPQMTVSADTTICAGETLIIGADAFLTGEYLWTPGGTAPTFEATPAANTQYALQFAYGDNCVFEDTVNVTVLPNFTLKLVSDPDTNQINAGDPILLDAFVPGTNVSDFSFEWFENNTDPVGNTQQVTVTPITISDSITYVVTVVSPAGCVQTGSITFAVLKPRAKVPNAFTPNGDGANDSFGLAIVEGLATIEKMEIYSRWGQKVFASNAPDARWDGTIDGNPAPSDVYVYVIFWRGGDEALKFESGEVTLLR